MRAMRLFALVLTTAVVAATPAVTSFQSRPPLGPADIGDLAILLKLEDTRQLDVIELARILKSNHPEVRRRAAIAVGRIADARGGTLLEAARNDRDVNVAAAVVFATGQLRQPDTIAWLDSVLSAPATPPAVAREAAQALGKMPGNQPDVVAAARGALAKYLLAAPASANAATVGEALMSWGRYSGTADLAPITRWITAADPEVRWRATWALFRPRDPAALPHLTTLSRDPSAEVRSWAVRGFTPAAVDAAKVDRAVITERLRALQADPDRRVRTEALRALLQFDDERAFSTLANALYSRDTWISVSAAEAAARFERRASVISSLLIDIADDKAPTALRITALNALATLAPEAAKTHQLAAALAKSPVFAARSAVVQALSRMGDPGRTTLTALAADPSIAKLAPPGGQTFEAMANAALARGAGGGGGGGGRGTGGRGAATPRQPRPDADYRALVERWIVPAYNGAPAPRAIWETRHGAIEIELYPGDAPFGVEHFIRVVESGDIVGTEFTRLVPDFVAQQQAIRNAVTLRDEVNQRGLTRGNLSWASAGLDTGRPGYTLGHTPQPHNEGNFTALGRVVRGMDVVDRLELGDAITAARMVTGAPR